MEIYFYRLEGESKGRLSLAIEVDFWYWEKQGKKLAEVCLASSLREAWSLVSGQRGRFKKLAKKTFKHRCPMPLEQACHLFSLLAGRALLWQEVNRLVENHSLDIDLKSLKRALQILILEQKCQLKPGVIKRGSVRKWQCERCHYQGAEIKATVCSSCGGECAVCEHCILMGRSSACTPFFLFEPGKRQQAKPKVNFGALSLTKGQQSVSRKIETLLDRQEKRVLVWAVTGAGKTEVMYPLIKKWLDRGKRILWATPRKDVVLELYPRFTKVFSESQVIALYGGSPQRWLSSSLVLATCHQVWRYYRYFDLVIVDEADAFPLYGDPALELGLYRAAVLDGQLVLLTATPPVSWQDAAKRGRLATVMLPMRYHGCPLPIPKLFLERRLWKKIRKGKTIGTLSRFLHHVEEHQGQAFIFVPRVQDISLMLRWLKENAPSFFAKARGVHARDPFREQRIREFRQGEWKILVTTTILERGVTVPHCHVLVVGGDHPVFDETTLVQIAGRVGRNKDYQKGVVWFLAEEKTRAQQLALKELRMLNHFAEKEGFY